MTRLIAVALLLLPMSTAAQALDCQHPGSDIDRVICHSADLMTARASVGVAYESLLSSLSGPARVHLIADQERWARGNQALCVDSIQRFTTAHVETQVAACLVDRMSARSGRLMAMPSGDAYPFISEQLMLKAGLAGGSIYRQFASYPRFDRPGVDNNALNQQIERSMRERIDVGPFPTPGDSYPGPWRVEIRHDLRFPATGVAAVLSSAYSQLDAVPPRSISLGMLVDVAAGKALGIDDVFTDGWRQVVAALCLEDMRRTPNSVPDEARLVAMLSQPDRWLFGRAGVEIVFRFNEEGATGTGARLVAIPYAKLKDVIRRDGPLAEKAR